MSDEAAATESLAVDGAIKPAPAPGELGKRIAAAKDRGAEAVRIHCEHFEPDEFAAGGYVIRVLGVEPTEHPKKMRLRVEVVGTDGETIAIDPDLFAAGDKLPISAPDGTFRDIVKEATNITLGGKSVPIPRTIVRVHNHKEDPGMALRSIVETAVKQAIKNAGLPWQ